MDFALWVLKLVRAYFLFLVVVTCTGRFRFAAEFDPTDAGVHAHNTSLSYALQKVFG
jgi:hypothetical protein